MWKREVWHPRNGCPMLNASEITGDDLIQGLKGENNGKIIYENSYENYQEL